MANEIVEIVDDRLLVGRPVLWSGNLSFRHWFLEHSMPVNLVFIAGNRGLPRSCFPRGDDPLRLRKLVKIQDDNISRITRKMGQITQHTLLIALPGMGVSVLASLENAQRLNTFVVEYLQYRKAYAVEQFNDITVEEGTFSLYVFPPGLLASRMMERLQPDDFDRLYDTAYLLLLLTTNYDEE